MLQRFPLMLRMMHRSLHTLCFAALMLCLPAHAAGILVMGDSLSAGYGIDQQKAWPVLLAQKLQREGYRHPVHNASISGETTAGGRSRFAAELARTKPDIVILELGANDGLRGLSLKVMNDNLDAMIRAAKDARAKVLILGMRMPPNLGQAYTQKFHSTFAELAKTHKTALVPFMLEGIATRRNLILEDGLHPTAEAQPLILDIVWPALKPLLK